MRIAIALASLAFVTACAGGGPMPPEVISFVSKEDGIKGSYDSSVYSAAHVMSRIGALACASGKTLTYGSRKGEEGRIAVYASCDGANKYEGTAGFTLNDKAKTGHITAPVDGKLVRIQL